MIIDIHSHIGDPWYAYWKQNVDVEDHLTSMDRWGIDKRVCPGGSPTTPPIKATKRFPKSFTRIPIVS